MGGEQGQPVSTRFPLWSGLLFGAAVLSLCDHSPCMTDPPPQPPAHLGNTICESLEPSKLTSVSYQNPCGQDTYQTGS